jgi:glycosyltransferase involved in cell wall biosynthesis
MAATGQLLTELAEDLVAEHGCEVTVIAGRPITVAGSGSAWKLVAGESHNGVGILRANGTRLRPRAFVNRALNYVSYFFSAAIGSFRVGRPDVVVSLTDPPIVGLLALWTAKRTGAKFLFLCEDIFPEVAVLLEDFHNDFVNRTLDGINRYLLKRADAIVALGDRMRRRLVEEKGADPGKIAIVHNWADCRAIAPGAKDNAFSRAHGLAGKFVVMHSGNLGLSQNLDVVIDAATKLRDRRDLVFALVGDGTKREALQRTAAERGLDNVRFFPYQPKAQLEESFAAADVFLVSLKPGIEGYIVPSKVYGILAAGRPYIAATDPSCEAAEIVRAHRCGLVAAPGDAADLAAKVQTLCDNRSEAAAMGARAREAALQFDRRTAVKAYQMLFERIAAAPAHQRQHEARV